MSQYLACSSLELEIYLNYLLQQHGKLNYRETSLQLFDLGASEETVSEFQNWWDNGGFDYERIRNQAEV